MILKLLDILRIAAVCVAFFFGYQIGFAHGGYDPVAQLHFMIPIIIVSIAGLSGMEGIFFAKESAKLKGFNADSNYKRQSAIALLSYAVVALLVYILNWGITAELTILFVFLFFFFFAGINHAVDALKRKNYAWQNINRPFITLLMIGGMIYPIVMALKILS